MILVKEHREALGMSQVQLAQASGVAQTNISKIERGRNPNVGILTLLALARGLGCSLDDLYRPDDEPEQKGA